ncbi:hypothetical protein ON010_g351 [Phytophthora cinnamomi]|nr:hypothetical protein ON010_g351 [Phytophthora cinnamomi]
MGSSAVLQSFSQAYGRITYPCGLCGVNGKYFDAALVCREIIETALQTMQAYRMSMLLPRTLLNRFYVILLAVNCWSSLIADSVFFGRDEARRRFACIVLDCILDLMSSMGVVVLVLLNYVGEYSTQFKGFDEKLWYNDEWVARALNELRIAVVDSWQDLVSRTIFSIGLVITTTSMKRLLWSMPRNGNRITQSATSIVVAVKATQKLLRKSRELTSTAEFAGPRLIKPSYKKWMRTHGDRIALRAVYLLFGTWGVIVLGLHINASMQPVLPQCFMQVRPWAVSRPSCYLAGLDCHTLGISGEKDEVEVKWSEFDASTVVQVLIRHCPELEVPPIISEFSGLRLIKIYNTTIANWTESAALTNKNHPQMVSLYIARSNFPDGLIPAGLQSPDFPQNLNDIEICVSNLRALPDDLAAKWRPGGIIYVEYSNLSSIPIAFVTLQPSYLAVTGNPITQVPPEIFEVQNMVELSVSSTKLQVLPQNVTQLSASLAVIYVIETGVSFFWSWIDDLVEHPKGPHAPLRATGSTYCEDLESLQNGSAKTFRIPISPGYSRILMNASKSNRHEIFRAVNCTKVTDDEKLFYPLIFDDSINAISTPLALVQQQMKYWHP